MTERLAVAAIIPVHNRETLIGEAIDSVLEQSKPAKEVIVVDDGSTDGTPDILRSYGNRIRVITQEQRGRSAARNTAIRAAECPVIAFLDSDDQWHRDKLARQLTLLERIGPALITGYIRVIDEEGVEDRGATRRSRRRLDRTRLRSFDFKSLVSQPAVYTSSWLIPKELLAGDGMFDESLHALEDWDLLLRLSSRTRIETIDWPPVIDYRIHVGNTASDAMARAAQVVVRRQIGVATTPGDKGALYLVLARNLRSLVDQRGARKACVNSVKDDPKLLRKGEWWRLMLGALVPKSAVKGLRMVRSLGEARR